MINKLKSLRKITKIAADTIDIDFIKLYKPEEVTTNPSLILKAIKINKYDVLIKDAAKWARKQSKLFERQVIDAYDKLIVNIGLEILKYISGKISIEIDASISYDSNACIEKARKIINLYNMAGINNNRILIKLAATWEGIYAAKQLKKEGINCNLTLIFSFAQAKACADAGVYIISPFVGRVLDWYKLNTNMIFNQYTDPGVLFVKKIFQYYKQNNYKTLVMAASFRNVREILQLVGCDYLTIAPKFLKYLSKQNGNVERKLIFRKSCLIKSQKILVKSEFLKEHESDVMASYMLSSGIKQFVKAQKELKNFFLLNFFKIK